LSEAVDNPRIRDDPRLRAQAMKSDFTQEFIDQLERDGIIVKTGKLERDSKGELQPTYAFSPQIRRR
jgi:hypothetical protein